MAQSNFLTPPELGSASCNRPALLRQSSGLRTTDHGRSEYFPQQMKLCRRFLFDLSVKDSRERGLAICSFADKKNVPFLNS